jgi:hypothetical protein
VRGDSNRGDEWVPELEPARVHEEPILRPERADPDQSAELPSPPSEAPPDDEENVVSQDGYALLTHEEEDEARRPDFYILALSLERTCSLLAEVPREEAPGFGRILDFQQAVGNAGALREMTGVQFFFDARTSIGRGHMYFPFSRWGLSSISQSEFWSARGGFSDGYFGVLSVDVCTTGRPEERGSFRHVLAEGPTGLPTLDDDGKRLMVARRIWEEISPRISEGDRLATPRCFHIDRQLSTAAAPRFLASLQGLDRFRPGRRPHGDCVGESEIEYPLDLKRWMVCGTFMATHTRMTTMEAANESARHAVRAILAKLGQSDCYSEERGLVNGLELRIGSLRNRTYNGASDQRTYDPPDLWNPEEHELDDLDLFRRVDRRLVALGLPHFMDIINFDRKLEHALEGLAIYGNEAKDLTLGKLLGPQLAGLDAVLIKELGRGYFEREIAPRVAAGQQSLEALQGGATTSLFTDLSSLVAGLRRIIDP